MLRNSFILFLIIVGLYLLFSPLFDLVQDTYLAEKLDEHPIEASGEGAWSDTAVQELKIVQPPYSEGDTIGSIKIPTLRIEWPLIEGRNQKHLNNGVGHLDHTAYPGEKGIVGLVAYQNNKPSRQLYSLDEGERLQITDYNNKYDYEIYRKETIAHEKCDFKKTSNEEGIMLITATENKENLFVIFAKRIY